VSLPLPAIRRFVLGLAFPAVALHAQFFSYDQVQEADRRAAEAEQRLLIGAVATVVLAATLVLRAAIRFRRRIMPGKVPEATTAPPATFLSSCLRVLGVALKILACIVVLLYLASCVQSDSGHNDFPAVYAYFLSASLLWLGTTCARQATRLRTPLAEEVLASDPRPPILYFRSFSEEEVALSKSDNWWLESSAPALLEEAVLNEFQKFGPVIGLSNPWLRGRPGTYAPYDTKPENWQERADILIGKAAAIVVVLAKSDGLAWEIRRLRDNGRLARTLFILPPLPPGDTQERLTWLLSEVGMPKDTQCENIGGSSVGVAQRLAVVISGGQPKTYLEAPDEGGYVLVVRRALKDLVAISGDPATN